MRNRFAMGLMFAAGISLVGCNGSDNSSTGSTASGGTTTTSSGNTAAGNGGKMYEVAVIPKGSTHEFWKAVHAGANDAGKEFGANITFKAPDKEDDKQGQTDVVESMINTNKDAIVIAPLDSQALAKPVKEALDKKTPVVIIDSPLADATGTVSLVATDNENGGKLAADEMIKQLGGKGKVIMLRYAIGSASTEAREKGFEEELKAKGPGITLADATQFSGPTVESARSASENLLARFKGGDGKATIDGIFCPNESSAQGMLLTIESLKWAGVVKFIGFDSNDKLVAGLKSGEVQGLVLQSPYKIGYEGVKAAVAALKGQKVDARIDTGATLITKDNMDKEENKKLLNPPQA